MKTNDKILGTDEAWESELLGNDESHMVALSEEDQKKNEAIIDEALGLKAISILPVPGTVSVPPATD